MSLWRILAISVSVGSILSTVYLSTRIGKFGIVRRITGDRRLVRFLFGLLVMAIVCLVLYRTVGLINMMIVLLHAVAIWLLSDLLFFIIRKIRGKTPRQQDSGDETNKGKKLGVYGAGIFALAFAVICLAWGWHVAHHVVETDYALTTGKAMGGENLRVVMFADSHVGATFHSREFEQYAREIEALNPDIVVVVGDFVDDDTSKEDMIACSRILGSIQTKYGVYYVYGNHDRGYFGREYRDYTGEDLVAELEKNGVVFLFDETELIDNRFYLIGREDASRVGRKDMTALLDGLDRDKYMIVLDHQPHDYEDQEKSGVDLVLSGHTHGGWLLPFNRMAEWMGIDDKTYGLEHRSDTDFIVTSGIAEWTLKFKTGTVSEYVVIDINESVQEL